MSRPGGLVGVAGAPSCCVFYVPTRHGKLPAAQSLAVAESLCVFSTRQTAGPTGTKRQDAASTTPGRELIRTPVRNSAADGGRLAASEKPHRLGYTVRTPGALTNPVGHGGTGAAGATPRDWRSQWHTARVVQPVAHGPIGTTSGTRREATSTLRGVNTTRPTLIQCCSIRGRLRLRSIQENRSGNSPAAGGSVADHVNWAGSINPATARWQPSRRANSRGARRTNGEAGAHPDRKGERARALPPTGEAASPQPSPAGLEASQRHDRGPARATSNTH